jgi:hypothetical protein
MKQVRKKKEPISTAEELEFMSQTITGLTNRVTRLTTRLQEAETLIDLLKTLTTNLTTQSKQHTHCLVLMADELKMTDIIQGQS